MALRNIIKYGDEILKKKSRKVEKFDERLALLIDDMKETLIEANGCGLAAVQVGILKRCFIVDVRDRDDDESPRLVEFINPEIIEKSGEQQEMEGCLSCPDQWGVTKRPAKVTIKAQDRNGEEFTMTGEGIVARAFCHEYDHLDGTLFLERTIKQVNPEEYLKNKKG